MITGSIPPERHVGVSQATEGLSAPLLPCSRSPSPSPKLTTLLALQQEEERADCKTPLAWRLTPSIRHEFVKTMRTVALLSMFSRDPLTIANSQAALKTMGYLEPELIFPAILERSWPALEGLLEVSCLGEKAGGERAELTLCSRRNNRRIAPPPSSPPSLPSLPLLSPAQFTQQEPNTSSHSSNSASRAWTSTTRSRR